MTLREQRPKMRCSQRPPSFDLYRSTENKRIDDPALLMSKE